MDMIDDAELLRRYAEAASESAFSELVARHLPLVYSAALRQVNGDAHLAQDVAQCVFTDLARKAASVTRRLSAESQVLSGWLYTSTRFAASKLVRAERRRDRRRHEAPRYVRNRDRSGISLRTRMGTSPARAR